MKQILGKKKLRVNKENITSTDNNKRSEEMSGSLILVQVVGQRTLHIPVFVKVYRSCFEHYAVVYRDVKYSACSTYINLKNCVVMYNENCKTQLRVIPHNMEGTMIVFDTEDKHSVSAWKSAFEDCNSSHKQSLSPVIPRSPLLPTLEEAIEEE